MTAGAQIVTLQCLPEIAIIVGASPIYYNNYATIEFNHSHYESNISKLRAYYYVIGFTNC